jgi:Arm DNA-binding domain/Phage integrase family/Phage integrase central domain
MGKRVLNDRIIKAIKPAAAGKRVEVWDALVPGLGVRVTDTGTKSFVLVARYGGADNPARRALGSYGALTLEQARNKAREWLALIQRGIDPQAEVERQRLAEQRKRAGTFASVCEDYIRDKLSTQRRGRDAELQLRNEFIKRWGERPITEITPADVKAVVREVKDRAPYMAHALLSNVRRMFNWAIEQGDYGLEHSPCDHLKAKSLIGERQPRSRILSDDEIRAFWRACVRMGYPHGDLGRALLLTGTRHREMAAAPWAEFDLARATWTIDQKRFKSNSEHIVPLTDDMLALIRDLPRFKSGAFLFSTSYGKIATDITEKVKTKIDERMLRTLQAMARVRGDDPDSVELRPWVIHDLRRTVRTHLAALRTPDHIAEMVLGHGKKGLQRVYDQHRYESEMREALERWAARLRSIVEPAPANVVPLAIKSRH